MVTTPEKPRVGGSLLQVYLIVSALVLVFAPLYEDYLPHWARFTLSVGVAPVLVFVLINAGVVLWNMVLRWSKRVCR